MGHRLAPPKARRPLPECVRQLLVTALECGKALAPTKAAPRSSCWSNEARSSPAIRARRVQWWGREHAASCKNKSGEDAQRGGSAKVALATPAGRGGGPWQAALLLRARPSSAQRAPGSARPRSLPLLGRTRARSQERRGIRSPQDPAGEDTNHVHTLNISSSPPTQPRECHVYNMDIIVR